MNDLTIVKLGGSLITDKDTPMKADLRAIGKVIAEIASAYRRNNSSRLILIHGGGSFGHYYASKYQISMTPTKVPSEGTSITAAAMLSLHSIVLGRLITDGVPCKTVLTSELLSERNEISGRGARYLRCLFENNVVPITFGNVDVSGRGSRIVSGDQIALALTRDLRVKKVIFAMDVDGIYQTSSMRGKILQELDSKSDIGGSLRKYDVTGGVISKIKIGLQIAKLGADVYYVNGRERGRVKSLMLNRKPVKATHIGAMRISMH